MITVEEILQLKKKNLPKLMKKMNVKGVGVGFKVTEGKATEELSLVILVKKKVPPSQLAPEDIIPAQIEGVPVDVQEVGEIRAH